MRIGFVLRWRFQIVAAFFVWNGHRVKKGVKPEIRYFISSLALSDWKPEEILSLIRNHWSIENGLHFMKDRWRDEDRHYLSIPGLGERFTCLLNRAVSIAGLLKKGKEPLTAVYALVRDKPKKCLKRLGLIK